MVSKDRLFPKNLMEEHDKLMEMLESEENGKTNLKIWPRYLELSKYTYNDKKYIIYPAISSEAMKEEGRHQTNCVGYMYLDSYAKGKTEIYFIRKIKNPTKSFITLEYKDKSVVQKELPNHEKNFKQEHLDFIDKWLNYRVFIDKKLKYQAPKIAKYNIEKLFA